MPLSKIVQLYHGVSYVSYQYYWSIHPNTSESVVMLIAKEEKPTLPVLKYLV